MAESSVFGDDINSTPIGKLTMPPMSMSSKNDPGAPGPVEPPVYSPVVETGRHVTFDDHDYVQEIPSRKSKKSKAKKSKKEAKNAMSMPAFHPGYWPAGPPQPPARPQKKQKRIFVLAAAYAHQIAVAALMIIALWYYPKIVAFPYMGDTVQMSTVGIAAVAAAAGVAYGVIEHIVD